MNPHGYAFALPFSDSVRLCGALRHIPYTLFFDSAQGDHPAAAASYIAFLPIETIESKDGQVTITNRDQHLSFAADPFAVLRDRLALWAVNLGIDSQVHRTQGPAFRGGAAGMFGYDLVRGIESLPSNATEDPDMPDMAIGIYHQLIAIDHATNEAIHIVHAHSGEEARRFHDALLRQLDAACPFAEGVSGDSEWRALERKSVFKDKIRKVIDYIHAGDIFQTVLSQKFEADLPADFDAFAHYCVLRRVNPAPFASYMNFGSLKLSSASPERFLKVSARQVETCPIKGTRPRLSDPHIDRLYVNELENSEKDRAENAMIVDLLRNDLSKVCEDHSVHVPDMCRLESFAAVHHLVSTVTATLRADCTPVDLLRACFPGGSITGCPKVRAMEISEELEPVRRGPYCGSLGWIGFHGDMDTNIAIRTLVYQGARVSFHTGSGIVADSDPEREFQETMDKAEAIFQSFEQASSAEAHAQVF